ncbi:hypothetical protein EJB05_19058, partial [Eragrostis curvula]
MKTARNDSFRENHRCRRLSAWRSGPGGLLWVRGHAYLGWRLEIRPSAKNRPGACAITHENGPKRQFLRKPWVSAHLSQEKWPGWSPMGERLLPLPLYMNINEILIDLHCTIVASNMCAWPQNDLKEAAHAPKIHENFINCLLP